MIEAIEFVQRGLLVAGEFHHAPEEDAFLVTAHEFFFTVAGDEKNRRGVSAEVKQRREVVDDGLRFFDASLVANSEVGDDLRTERDEADVGTKAFTSLVARCATTLRVCDALARWRWRSCCW
ncbi:MAG: hypothetical protein RL015_3429 [Verrucomicrobiota bacterium]